jgi:hypothetical protein
MNKNENIPDANVLPDHAYVTWSDENIDDKRIALNEASKSLDEFSGIERSVAGRYGPVDWSNLSNGPTSGRPGLTRSDYEAFRPDEAIPKKLKSIMQNSDLIYNRVGLVKNVIDLMGDFASQGVRISHPNQKVQAFYRNWFEKVKGADRSERFLNNLYRLGNVVINRQTAKISVKVEKEMYKAVSSPDSIINYSDIVPDTQKREIPWKYTFIDPSFVDVIGGPLSSFIGKKVYAIVLPANLRKIIKTPKSEAERSIVAQLPSSIIDAAQTKKPYVLDPEKTLVFHYKKDDWKAWAFPIIYSVMDDINTIEKLKLADLAALDGAISNIRIFKLGSLEHKIAPTAAAASKLSSILQNNVGGGTMDLVWGPDIELIESKSNVYQFLGQEKYIPHLNMVYAGLGIPPTLTGTYGAAGTTNNFISLKTLTQRLQYGRRVLLEFWNNEIKIVQKAMGFKQPAMIEFERMDLSNEEAEKALLIQLADRNIISDELLQTNFGIHPELEKSRLNKESKDRRNDRMVQKSGPYHDPEFDNSLRKISLQLGLATPSQVGLDLEERKPGELTTVETKLCPPPCAEQITQEQSPGVQESKNSNPNENGRPQGVKDTQKRKQREFKPQEGIPQNASLQLWGIEAQEKISEILNPYLLEFYSKKNMRSLSSEEYAESEEIKTKIFMSLEPLRPIKEDIVLSKLNTIDSIENKELVRNFQNFLKLISADMDRPMTTEETKYSKAYFYTTMVY